MARTKKSSTKKTSKSTKMRAKLANKMRIHEEVAKPNPFELKFTRTKHQVLGKASSKVVGAPIKAREKSQKTRSEKLMRELDKGGKRNALKDRRLKENDSRYAEVQKQKYAGGERSAATDDTDTLTHFGRSIAELERLDDKPREVRDSGSDSEDDRQINAAFVSGAHFGGFDSDDDDERVKNPNLVRLKGSKLVDTNKRKTLIETLISHSKDAKHERQMMREANVDLTEQLDAQWKHIVGDEKELLDEMIAKRDDNDETKTTQEQGDDYDALYRQLTFAADRAAAGERIRTAEQLAVVESSADTKKNKLIDSLTRDDRPCADADATSLDLTEQLHILCQSTAVRLDDENKNKTKRKKSSAIAESPEKHAAAGVYSRLHEQIAASARRTDKNRAERDLVETCRTLLNELHAQHMHDDQQWPALDACAVVQLIFSLYPFGSDNQPTMYTLCMLYATRIISTCRLRTVTDLRAALMWAKIIIRNIDENHKYVPELFMFVCRAVQAMNSQIAQKKHDAIDRRAECDRVEMQFLAGTVQKSLKRDRDITTSADENTHALYILLKLVVQLVGIYLQTVGVAGAFAQVRHHLLAVEKSAHPIWLQNEIVYVIAQIETAILRVHKPLRRNDVAIKSIHFKEPRFEQNFDPDRKSAAHKLKGRAGETKRLQKSYKREMRGAQRELRRDTQTVARIQMDRRAELDTHRQKKTNEIIASLRAERHDGKVLERMK